MFSLASATLKQAFQDLPEITHIADNLIVQDDEDGVNIVIADQEGRAMFPEGSKYPYEDTRAAIAALAPILAQMPNQIRISGHTASGGTYPNPRYGKWELSADRANVVRSILQEYGVPDETLLLGRRARRCRTLFPQRPPICRPMSASRSCWWSSNRRCRRASSPDAKGVGARQPDRAPGRIRLRVSTLSTVPS